MTKPSAATRSSPSASTVEQRPPRFEVGQWRLNHLISAMRWDDALSSLKSNPIQAEHITSPFEETPLLAACRIKAPPSLVEALLEACPEAATLRQKGSGRTPLHLACSDLRRTSQGRGFDDDESVVRLLLAVKPEAAAMADKDGWLPLHCVCSSGPGLSSEAAPLSLIRCLLSAHPASALTPNRGGVTPLAMLWTNSALNEEDGRITLSSEAARFYDRIDEVERRRAALAAENPDHSRTGAFRPRQNSASVWAKVILMARAAYEGRIVDGNDGRGSDAGQEEDGDSSRPFRPVHALAGIDCPPSVVEFAVRVHSDEPARTLLARDENGNLPLHLASSRPCGGGGEDALTRVAVVKLLIDACPRAACVQNAAGRIPLNLAMEAGHSWDSSSDVGERGCIKELFEAAPEALGARDAVKRLYPFMLAASVDSLDVSYRLLKLNPGLVALGMKAV